jgi:hypothetical protein
MRRVINVFAVAALAAVCFARTARAADAVDVRAVLEEANTAYSDGAKKLSSNRDGAIESFKKSAALYKRAAEAAGDSMSGALMYDIGNASMLAGDTGEAVLWYKRAERVMPNDAAVKANLAKAREKVGANVPRGGRGDSFMDQLTMLEFVAPAVRFWVAAVAFAGMWGLALVRVWSAGWRPSRLGVAACGAVALVAGGSLAPRELRLREAREAVVLNEITGRAGPDAGAYEAKPASPLKGGTEVRVVEERGSWLLVELGDGTTSWVEGKGVERVAGVGAGKSTK